MDGSFEAAVVAIQKATRGKDVGWLSSSFEASKRRKAATAEDLHVFSGMVGIPVWTMDPVLRGAAWAGFQGLTFDQFQDLALCHEDLEVLVSKVRVKLRTVCAEKDLLSYLAQRRGAPVLTRRGAYEAFIGLENMSSCLACVLAERFNKFTAKDVAKFLHPPRSLEVLRQLMVDWCNNRHGGSATRCFDALDYRGTGLLGKDAFLHTLENLHPTDVDAILESLDVDGSGCVSRDEFEHWLNGDDKKRTSSKKKVSPSKQAGVGRAGVFAAAAAQLREALTARSEGHRLKEEFDRIDLDKSGELNRDEFATFLSSVGVQVVDTEEDLMQEERRVVLKGSSLAGMGLKIEERVRGHRGVERSLVIRETTSEVHERDEMLSVKGKPVVEIAAELDDDPEYLDRHPMDALTRKVDAYLNSNEEEVALVVRRSTAASVTRQQLECLVRGMDEDNNGTVSFGEIEHFILAHPEDGEADLMLVVAAIRERATRLAAETSGEDEDHELTAAARVFGAVARAHSQSPRSSPRNDTQETTSKRIPHVLKTTAIKRWLRTIKVDAGGHRKTVPSRRQVNAIVDQLDANGDGVVSRSEFDAWVFPRRPLPELKALLRSKVLDVFDGDVVAFHARLQQQGPVNRLDLARSLAHLGCAMKAPEIDVVLNDIDRLHHDKHPSASKKRLPLHAFADLLGFDVDDAALAASSKTAPPSPPPSGEKKNVTTPKKGRSKPSAETTTKLQDLPPPPPPVVSKQVVVPQQQDSGSTRRRKKVFAQKTPEDMKRERLLARERAQVKENIDTPFVLPDIDEKQSLRLARLQARARGIPCRSAHDALRREAAALIECEAALLQVAALKLELVAERTKQTARVVAVESKCADDIAAKEIQVDRIRYDADKARAQHDQLNSDLQAELTTLKASLNDKLLDERRQAASHYREKLKQAKSKVRDSSNTQRPPFATSAVVQRLPSK